MVTRQEEQVDPEDEADFEREYAKMMAESLESRKHERKATFDVPLPIRRKDANAASEPVAEESINRNATPAGTMAFSLLTKRGNRQQVRKLLGPVPFGLLILCLDSHRRPSLRLYLRGRHENSAGCREGGTATNQEPRAKL